MQMSKGPLIYTKAIGLRLTPEQKEEIQQAATRVGDVLGRFVRQAVLEKSRKINKTA